MPDQKQADKEAIGRALGQFLAEIRKAKGWSLRLVEEKARERGYELSNAYLSQLENGKVLSPSPHVLHSLADVYGIAYEQLMRKAGYYMPKKGIRTSAFSSLNLTNEEEAELIAYLRFRREREPDD